MTISILNYGCGNIGSIPNMLKRCGVDTRIVSTPDELQSADKIIMPGVGSFGHAMDNITRAGLKDILHEKAIVNKVPILGICLGMQLFAKTSAESPTVDGLGWIEGHLKRFNATDASIKIPHMGWNRIHVLHDNPLVNNLDQARFYHVHSYHYDDINPDNIIATAHHGYDFPTIIAKDNIMGVQFHPEKSHRYGLALLKNFAEM